MLLNIPVELLWIIWEKLESFRDRNTLILTCRQCYHMWNNDLYRRAVKSKDKALNAMLWAAWNGRETTMQKFLDHKANPGINESSDIQRDDYEDGYSMLTLDSNDELEDQVMSCLTPLACAAQRGHVSVAKLLIDAGANVNAHGGDGGLPVIWAVGQAQAEVLAVLLVAGADTNIEVGGLGTLLTCAAAYGHAEIVRVLLAKGIMDSHCAQTSYTQSELEEPLYFAVCRNHKDVVRVFIEAGADINKPVFGGQTPLGVAALDGLDEMVDLLLEAGANVNAPDRIGDPPLYRAIRKGHLVSAITLLDGGASIGSFETPLAAAVSYDQPEIVRVLLERSGDTEAREDNGDTPLLVAARYNSRKSARFLLKRGADPNVTDKNGYTPLCLAVLGRCVEVVLTLLDDDDNPPETWNYHNGRQWELVSPPRSRFIDTPDSLNRTPLFLATMYGYSEIARLLLSRGSNAIQTQTVLGRTPLSFADVNKDKRLSQKSFHGKLRSIFDLLQTPSQATVDALLVQNASKFGQDEDEENGSEGEAYIVECNACFSPISDYDEPSVCGMCKYLHGYSVGLCPECRAAGRICHDETDVPVKADQVIVEGQDIG